MKPQVQNYALCCDKNYLRFALATATSILQSNQLGG